MKINGFTLAEVLITLGIIGITAAMTMPVLFNKTQNKELQTAFLKTYSELNQLALLFAAENGVTIPEYTAGKTGSAGISVSDANLIFSYYKGSTALTSSGQGSMDDDGNFIAFYDIHYLNGKNYSGGGNSTGANSSFLCDNTGFRNNRSVFS